MPTSWDPRRLGQHLLVRLVVLAALVIGGAAADEEPGRTHIAVDFNGAEAVALRRSPGAAPARVGKGSGTGKPAAQASGKAAYHRIQLGDASGELPTFASSGTQPQTRVTGDTLVLGGQTLTFTGGRLTPKTSGPMRTTP